MDFDDVSSTVTVTDTRILNNIAYFRAEDENGIRWVVTLDVGPFVGAKRWFAETVQNKVRESGTFPLTSTYDLNADEWYVRAGNYGIHSKDLQFTRERA